MAQEIKSSLNVSELNPSSEPFECLSAGNADKLDFQSFRNNPELQEMLFILPALYAFKQTQQGISDVD